MLSFAHLRKPWGEQLHSLVASVHIVVELLAEALWFVPSWSARCKSREESFPMTKNLHRGGGP